LKYF